MCIRDRNTGKLAAGVLQTVADLPGTEMILESTANGVGNFFHQACMDALEGKGLFELVFIPWYWQDEYKARITDEDLLEGRLTTDEERIVELYGLTKEQLQWRRHKISSLKSLSIFKQEYPFTVQEAFQFSGESLFKPEFIERASNAKVEQSHAPLILGVDPARTGDRTVIAYRRGRDWFRYDVYETMDEMLLAGKLANIIEKYGVKKCFIDRGGGQGTIDRLHELNYRQIVTGVHFGQKPNSDLYTNKRAEMAGEARDWLEDEGLVSIPDSAEVAVELGAIPNFTPTSNGLHKLPSKDKIKEDYGKSPDIVDAFFLTFAQPVRADDVMPSSSMRRSSEASPLQATRKRRVRDMGSPRQSRSNTWTRSGRK